MLLEQKHDAQYLFKWLCALQVLMYLEAGAVPALLIELAAAFDMSLDSQGLLGGIVYFMLSTACPVAGWAFSNRRARPILLSSIIANVGSVVFFALVPTTWESGTAVFIGARAAIGFTQAFLCIYSPIWVDTFAPAHCRTRWIGMLQGAVPLGVMAGYALGAVSVWVAASPASSGGCGALQCWRYPFLLQCVLVALVVGRMCAVPSEHFEIRVMVTAPTLSPAPAPAPARSPTPSPVSAARTPSPADGDPTTLVNALHMCRRKPSLHLDHRDVSLHAGDVAVGSSALAGVSAAYAWPRPSFDALQAFGDDDEHDDGDEAAVDVGSSDIDSPSDEAATSPYAPKGQGCAQLLLPSNRATVNPIVAGSALASYGSFDGTGGALPFTTATAPPPPSPRASTPLRTPAGGAICAQDHNRNARSPSTPLVAQHVALVDVKTLLFMPLYTVVVFALAAIYFVVTGVQFWSTSCVLV